MRWFSNRPRSRAVGWRSQPARAILPSENRGRLCDLLNADTLDDLVRVACEEMAGSSGITRLLVAGWNMQKLGPWAVFPQTSENRVLSSALDAQLPECHTCLAPGMPREELARHAQAMGFDDMTLVASRRHLTFQVYWTSSDHRGVDLRAEGIWPDLEAALCNYARLDQLRELSYIDTLTNVFNRRYFNHRLTEEFARAERFARPLALAICDLDRFKLLNDTHGHQAGDVVLRYMAQTLRRSVRAIDIVCRLGGDEFSVLMPDTGTDECASLAERLLQSVSSGGFTLGGRDVSSIPLELRISIGGAVFPGHAARPERLLWCADMALLDAKRRGGNCYVLCDPTRIQRGAAL